MKTSSQNHYLAWINWGIATSFVILIFSYQTGYAITHTKMASSLSLSLSDIGIIGSTYTFVFAFCQIFSGSILDQFGTRLVLPLACTLLTLGIFSFAFCTSLIGFIFAQTCIAIGASFGFIGAGMTGKYWFSQEKYGMMFALVQFVASLSAFLTQVIFIQLIANYPWDWVINGLGMIGLVILFLMFIFLQDPKNHEPTHKNFSLQFFKQALCDVKIVILHKHMVFILISGALSFGVMLSLSIVWGIHLAKYFNINANNATLTVALSWLGLALGAPFFAWLGRRLHNDITTFTIGTLVQISALLIMTLMPNHTFISLSGLMFIFGFATGASMLPFNIAATMVPSKYTGTSAALVNGSQFLMGSFLMFIPGFLMENHITTNIHQALILFPILLILSMVTFYLFIIRKQSIQ